MHFATGLDATRAFTLASLASLQRRTGHDVAVVVCAPPQQPRNWRDYVQVLTTADVGLRTIDAPPIRHGLIRFDVLRRFTGDLSGSSFDVIHAHDEAAGVLAASLGATSGSTPVTIRTVHGLDAPGTSDRRPNIAVLNGMGRVVVPSACSRDLLARLGVAPASLRVVPYATDPVIDPLDGLDADDPELRAIRALKRRGRGLICCVDSICDPGGQRLLLEAIATMPESTRPHCVWVGEGDVSRVPALAGELGVREIVWSVSHRPRPREFVRYADWLVVPSVPSGRALLPIVEAFCDRVPVLATESPEVAEIFANGEAGLMCPAHDRCRLSAALLSAMRMSANLRDEVRGRGHEAYRARHRSSMALDLNMRVYEEILSAVAQGGESRRAA